MRTYKIFFPGAALAVLYAVSSSIGVMDNRIFSGVVGNALAIYVLVACLYIYLFSLVQVVRNEVGGRRVLWLIGHLLITVPIAVAYVVRYWRREQRPGGQSEQPGSRPNNSSG